MRLAVRHFVLGILISMFWAGAASAQYMRITTDNPTDNTRMRASGTTILTVTLDTNHDKGPNADGSGGALQTCNSHTTANSCGAATTTQNLDMFSYTLALKAVGGTVTFGTFSVADAAYTDTSPQIQSETEVEINKGRCNSHPLRIARGTCVHDATAVGDESMSDLSPCKDGRDPFAKLIG